MSKKVVTHMCLAGVITCGLKEAQSLTGNRNHVTCKRCLKKLGPVKPIPAIPAPKGSDDWRWPLSADKLDDEMQRRKVVLYGYYEAPYRRKLTWHPYSKQLEVKCEDSSWRFSEDHMGKALDQYNNPKVFKSENT